MKKKYLIISIVSILIMMVGFSYAYFTSMIVGEGSPITVSAKKLAIIFTDTEEIADSVINPGWEVSKTFTIENKSGSVFYYDINIEDLINTFVTEGYLQYKITSTDGGYNMSNFIDIPKSSEARRENLAQKIKIEDNEVHTYTIEFKYPNDPNVNQSEDMGMILSGSLSITESEILVVKYKVDGIVQDELPSKEIPYIVGGVECTNNAKGVWNEEEETVELETPVRQTVCIVDFEEGYVLSMLTEHGEVVSPVSKVVGRIGTTTFDIEEKSGYSLSDAKIVCDNGAEGSITNKIITITNIKRNNLCKVITNPIDVTVTYDVNGGSTLSQTSKTVTYTGTYGSLPTPSRTGYTFSGWYTSATGGSKIEEDTEVTSTVNHTIYAHWNSNTINLTLNNQSATIGGSTNVYYRYNTATYYENSGLVNTITKITVPTRTGYTFGGYYTTTNGSGTQYIKADGTFINNPHTNISANTTLYARWTVNTYTVAYNQNGGSGVSPTSNTVTYGAKYKLPTTNPTKAGYTFVGWFTALDGGTQVTTNTTLTNANNHSIYAHWTINSYTVTVNVVNGYVTNTNPLGVNYGGSGTFTIVANTGYKLDGASVTCDGGTYNQAGTLTVSNVTSVRTCTVILAKSEYLITFSSKTNPDVENEPTTTSACYYAKNGASNYPGHTNCQVISSSGEKYLYDTKCDTKDVANMSNINYAIHGNKITCGGLSNLGDNYKWATCGKRFNDEEGKGCRIAMYFISCTVTIKCDY